MKAVPRCSIARCPWKARYSFEPMAYYECWFHGGMISWLNVLWDFLFYYPRFLYICIRYGHQRWKMNPYFMIKELIENEYGN